MILFNVCSYVHMYQALWFGLRMVATLKLKNLKLGSIQAEILRLGVYVAVYI